jgi:lipopolysaccharide biosynthesis regulator YciM
MTELLLLLLPLAAASGWIAAKRSSRGNSETPRVQDPAYFKGLNYLLNEQPDKAIDVFIQMLEVDSDTVETHLALGNLFRRRGEVERAIRIHQNLIARPTLNRDHRAQALLELGKDYMRAGLFDRAENLFEELTETALYQKQALGNLLKIYEREKEWEKCLQVSRRLESLSGEQMSKERAHYHCELAEEAKAVKDLSLASKQLKQAQALDRNCTRASILLGQMEHEAGDHKAAIRTFQKVGQQDDGVYISEILPALADSYSKTNKSSELRSYLQQLYTQNQGYAEALAMTDIIRQEDGDAAAVSFLTGHLQKKPSLEGLEHLLDLPLQGSSDAPADILNMLRDLINKLLEEQQAYQCQSCGFGTKAMHWQCPSCHAWSSIKPVHAMNAGR